MATLTNSVRLRLPATVVCLTIGALAIVTSPSCKHATEPPSAMGMDTTSHNIIWQKSLLGNAGSSGRLYDVAIVNDSLAYAVGEIYLRDSTGQIDPFAYSVAVWNGSTWNLKRLYYNSTNLVAPIRGIFSSGPNNLWLAAGSVLHWDGIAPSIELRFSRLTLSDPLATIERVWGTSSGNLYGVGNVGTVVFYDLTSWQVLPSGTTLPITDVIGAINPTSGGVEIIAVAGNPYIGFGREILGISGTSVSLLPSTGINNALSGAWFVPGERHYVVGGGIYHKDRLADSVWSREPIALTNNFTRAVRGIAANDVFIVGDFGEVVHFNGNSWKSYLPQTAISSGGYYSLSIKGGLIMAVGEESPRAVVLIGRRL